MKRILLGTLAAAAVSAFALTAAPAQSDQPSKPTMAERMQHWAADRGTLLDAKLAGIKAALGLTADQEKLWSPFESAVKDASKARMDAMQKMMQTRDQDQHMSPVDHLQAIADRLSQGAADVKKIADTAKPLYDGLDASQKEKFAMLGRDMLMPERARLAMEWMHHHWGEREGGGAE
jgi:gas vesicle protein